VICDDSSSGEGAVSLLVWKKGHHSEPFHPQIIIRDTGYANNHWNGRHGAFDNMFHGLDTVRQQPDVAKVITDYLDGLRRMGFKVVAE